MKTVLIADDHPIFRSGLRSAIEDDARFTVVAEVADGKACIAQAELLKPHVIVCDLSMPNLSGFDVARWARAHLPEARIVLISMHSGPEFMREAQQIGVAAFVAKEDSSNELINAMTSVLPFFLSSTVGNSASVMQEPKTRSQQDEIALLGSLSGAELRVMRLIAQSKTSREIADRLGLSHRTVQTHRQNISAKLALRGANSLLNFAMRNRSWLEDGG